MAKAALRHISNELLEESTLFSLVANLLDEFNPDVASFERFALKHRVLRHSVASDFALHDDRQLDLRKSTPYTVVLSGTNVVDSLLNEKRVEQVWWPFSKNEKLTRGKKALVLINTKYCQSGVAQDGGRLTYKDYIQEQIKKRRWLAHKLPQFEHIMVIATNKTC